MFLYLMICIYYVLLQNAILAIFSLPFRQGLKESILMH